MPPFGPQTLHLEACLPEFALSNTQNWPYAESQTLREIEGRLVVGSALMKRYKLLDLAIPEARNPLNIPIRGANKCFPLHQANFFIVT